MKKLGTIYEDRKTVNIAKVYNYTLNIVKEMGKDGWKLTGTYYGFLTFVKDKM